MIIDINKPSLDELKHVGVLGMKWGHTKTEISTPSTNHKLTKDQTDSESKKGLTNKQKKYLKIAAITVASALVIYGAYKFSKSDTFIDLVNGGKKRVLEELDLETGFAKTKDVNIECINHINYLKPGTYMNCGNSTIALELRKRGFDVVAKENPTGMYDLHMGQYFKLNSESIKNISWSEGLDPRDKATVVRATLERGVKAQFPDGARGSVLLPLENGNHFIGWSLNQGKLILEDAQNPKMNYEDLLGSVSKNSFLGKKYNGAQFARLDDAEININKIREVVKSKTGLTMLEQRMSKFKDLNYNMNTIEGPSFVMTNFEYAKRRRG